MISAGENALAGGIHRFVVFGHPCGSATPDAAEEERHRVGLYAAFDEAYGSVGVEPGTFHQEDRGDGLLVALRPDVSPTLMVGRWIDTLYESLRTHNVGRRRRLRLRIGMNAGLVARDARGLVGRAVDRATQLCDSVPARRIMAESPEVDLLVVVSDWLYANVVVEGGRYVEPGHYRPARIRSAETDETAWFHVPRRAAPPLPAPEGGTDASGGKRTAGGWPRTGAGPLREDDWAPRAGDGKRPHRTGGELVDPLGDTVPEGAAGASEGPGPGEPG
ncbi:hypothetical protein ACFW2Y_13470 [Streptomyces sp. NPDC058877]|uniref:hypothetical protein n=1 Tax=unclassified Streptomyces TaxID=2593676 RepID=UPI0036B1B5A9